MFPDPELFLQALLTGTSYEVSAYSAWLLQQSLDPANCANNLPQPARGLLQVVTGAAAAAGKLDAVFTAADLLKWRAAVRAYLTECARHARLSDSAQPCESLALTCRKQFAWVKRWRRAGDLDKLRFGARKEFAAAAADLRKLRCRSIAADRADFFAGRRLALVQAGPAAQLDLKEAAATAAKVAQELRTACEEASAVVTDAKQRVDALDACVPHRERQACKPRTRTSSRSSSSRDVFNAYVRSLGPVGAP